MEETFMTNNTGFMAKPVKQGKGGKATMKAIQEPKKSATMKTDKLQKKPVKVK